MLCGAVVPHSCDYPFCQTKVIITGGGSSHQGDIYTEGWNLAPDFGSLIARGVAEWGGGSHNRGTTVFWNKCTALIQFAWPSYIDKMLTIVNVMYTYLSCNLTPLSTTTMCRSMCGGPVCNCFIPAEITVVMFCGWSGALEDLVHSRMLVHCTHRGLDMACTTVFGVWMLGVYSCLIRFTKQDLLWMVPACASHERQIHYRGDQTLPAPCSDWLSWYCTEVPW